LGRAPGGDCIAPELVKLAFVPAATALHELFRKVWTSGHVPSEWKEGIRTSLHKGKGAKTDCSSYRLISLLLYIKKTARNSFNVVEALM